MTPVEIALLMLWGAMLLFVLMAMAGAVISHVIRTKAEVYKSLRDHALGRSQ